MALVEGGLTMPADAFEVPWPMMPCANWQRP
jgi:hypothetical protein